MGMGRQPSCSGSRLRPQDYLGGVAGAGVRLPLTRPEPFLYWLAPSTNLVVTSWTEARNPACESFISQSSKYYFLLFTGPQLLWRVVAKVMLWITEVPMCVASPAGWLLSGLVWPCPAEPWSGEKTGRNLALAWNGPRRTLSSFGRDGLHFGIPAIYGFYPGDIL